MIYLKAEVFAQANGLIQLALSMLLFQNRRMQSGWGLGWLSLSMAGAGSLNLLAPWVITPNLESIDHPAPILISVQIILGVGCLAALFTGLLNFCGRRFSSATRTFTVIFVSLPLVFALFSKIGMPYGGEWVTFALMSGCAVIAWQTDTLYPGAGHRQLAFILALDPVVMLSFNFLGDALPLTRYLASGPFSLIGLALLSVTLNRLRVLRERALDELRLANLNLENQVKQRTTEISRKNQDLEQTLIRVNASEARLQEILNASGEGIWDWNLKTGVLFNNRRWCEIMGLNNYEPFRDFVIFQNLVASHERKRVRQVIERSLNGTEPYKLEYQVERPDGAFIWVLDKGDVVERDDAGAPLRMVGTISDITDQKLEHEALVLAHQELRLTKDQMVQSEKMAALGALVAGVSHELNTPLGNAVTAASTLQDERKLFVKKLEEGLTRSGLKAFIETVAEAGDLIERNLEKANALIHSFKRVAVDQSTFNRRPFDLGEVVHEIVLTMSPTIKRTPIEVSVNVAPGLMLDGYPGALGQALMNLINNALIHGFEGATTGHIAISADSPSPGWVVLTVSDDGCGMTPDLQQKIFNPFFTTRLGKGGSGLGLHIVFNVVSGLLGGTVTVESSSGKGSSFHMKLPFSAPVASSQ